MPFDSLNLAIAGNDAPWACQRNLELLLDDFAPGADPDDLADLSQVHGCDVVHAGARAAGAPRPAADGIVTDRRGVVLLVRAADCVPVLIGDPDAPVIGAVHAGRPGVAQGVVTQTVSALRDLGGRDLVAWIGPHVCGSCYEVPEEMRADVGALVPAAVATTSWGTPSLDLGAGVRAQLEEAGVQVNDVSRCTRESADLFSYRRDGSSSGRLAGVVRLRP